MSKLIFEASRHGRRGYAYPELDVPQKEVTDSLGPQYLRIADPDLPELSEVDVVRHYINLSRKNYGVDLGFYPLGSCTMKYKPKINEDLASLPGFLRLHPLQPVHTVQGILRLLHETTTLLCEITGMKWGTLQPLAGAHGEFTGMKLFRAYFNKRGESARTRILVPDSSHGTNPASAHLSGFEVVELPSNREGMVSLEELDKHLNENLAGIMLTNPNTLGLFEKDIRSIAGKVHKAGGLLYYDGANSNAIMGKVRPGDMGFDVVHLNLHKTFSTPHGGGGPGSGPVLVSERLVPFLPIPDIVKSGDAYALDSARHDSIGRVAGFFGNVGIVIRAYAYILAMGAEGLKKASEYAVLNANYLKEKLKKTYRLPYDQVCKHEFVLSAKEMKDRFGVTALDIAKRLLDYGVHPPTIYFPLIVAEALMIEPTETESKESLDAFIDVMRRIREEAEKQPELLKEAPSKTPVRRIDEVLAAKQPILRFKVRPLETMLNEKHKGLDAKMVEFGGWEMPLQYSGGILQEHLATRKGAGLFDISHMGRFIIRGAQGLAFLQHVLTGNAAALTLNRAQYTMIANESGGAIDDCYLYRFQENEYLLVVNAANSQKDWEHLNRHKAAFPETEMIDKTKELAMLSLQGPGSRRIMEQLLPRGGLPEPGRNNLSVATLDNKPLLIGRTGYTGEPLGFELFADSAHAEALWSRLIELGAVPVGLGARDSLRLEAGLPLYGNELGLDPEGKEIPIFALSLARFAVSFHRDKGEFIGRAALQEQISDLQKILDRDFKGVGRLKQIIQPISLIGKGVARHGDKVFINDRQVGWITSGTVAPYWKTAGDGLESRQIDEIGKRPVCLGLMDSSLLIGQEIDIDVRGKRIKAVIVPHHLRSEAPPQARAIIREEEVSGASVEERRKKFVTEEVYMRVDRLLDKAIENTRWRQEQCLNLIPSEMTASPMVRLLSVMDPSFRYAEHKKVKALHDADIFYYQGTGFIDEVERLLAEEMRTYLGCRNIESRVISGQMANAAVFSALVDFVNRGNRKQEPRRLRPVMNNHIIKGGHLSAQPMGALHDFIARDPATERPAIVNFPVLADNPYKIDMEATRRLLGEHRPELIILGKSMVIHKEPVAGIRAVLDEIGLRAVLMYDMAHVLGLAGPHFQQPFAEGADIVTGSTHKTFFGTQRGIIANNFAVDDQQYPLWEAIENRTFPGSVSNHHLGTLLGLLMAAYEMNHFKDEYQKNVVENAKGFAKALVDAGLHVAGDPAISYTETHQVIVQVGYAKGIETAQRLEENNIIVNFQATPDEEGFTASGGLRLGVSEMTRFGFGNDEFRKLAGLIRDVVLDKKKVGDEVIALRRDYQDLKFCFSEDQFAGRIEALHGLI